MSCDSGLGSSEEAQTIKQDSNTLEGGESYNKITRTESSLSDGHVSSSSEVVDSNDHATPVESDRGNTQSEQGLKTEESNAEPEVRRGRGRPKGAKNKNPKPKPPPKPKRPKGRPRKYTYLLAARATRQHPYARIEPVSAEPPDNIFED